MSSVYFLKSRFEENADIIDIVSVEEGEAVKAKDLTFVTLPINGNEEPMISFYVDKERAIAEAKEILSSKCISEGRIYVDGKLVN